MPRRRPDSTSDSGRLGLSATLAGVADRTDNDRPEAPMWKLRADVGGTFTDCVGESPAGDVVEAKVLSSGAVRGEAERVSAEAWRLAPTADARPFAAAIGGRVRLLGTPTGGGCTLVGVDQAAGVLRVSGDLGAPESTRGAIEVSANEPAPILAARLLTGAPVGESLPPCEFRLATTKATNALLERSFARVGLLVTEGFGDLLLIGDQRRPALFELDIVKPEPVTRLVYEVPGRLDPCGAEVVALDEPSVHRALESARASGAESIAVALVHAWADPRQEARVREIALDAGFEHIVTSASITPRLGLLARAQAAVIEAALAPVLGGYIDRVREPLAGSRLRLLTSSGGLCAPDEFRAVDSLLSGPAGGVVGAGDAGAAAGHDRVMSFDMGGTSTDVARIDGMVDLVRTHRVGEARVERPAVAVETVAAGGGSICRFEDGRPCVGPESAGADPGPACYGAGGPLTITDVNVLLGRIDTRSFGVPLSVEAARTAFERVLQSAPGEPDPDQTLVGLLDLANERIAEAIRRVSVRRGYDPAEHALVAFGGAGPQHACDVAAKLGMAEVIVPARASLLSAVGVHAAALESSAEAPVMRALHDTIAELPEIIARLRARADAGLGEAPGPLTERVEVSLRLFGQDAAVVVTDAPLDALIARFAEAYARVHGVRPAADRAIEVVEVRVTRMTRGGDAWPAPAALGRAAARTERAHDGRSWAETPMIEHASLSVGATIAGPTMVTDGQTTTWIALGWSCVKDKAGALRLTRTGMPSQDGARATARDDAVSGLFRRELMVSRLGAIAEQMGEALERAAVSVNVKERRDFSCGVLDGDGLLVTSAPHIPVHLGALGYCVRRVLETLSPLEEGEAAVTNHPAFGGSHLPDVTVVQPVFDVAGARLGYVASRAHHSEIGGLTPGSMPPTATRLSDEGVPIRPTLVRGDDLDAVRALLVGHRLPTRAIADNLADLSAALVAGRRAAREIGELARDRGANEVARAMAWITRHTAERVGAVIEAYSDVASSTVETMDDGSVIRVAVGVPAAGRLKIDFTGTSPVGAGTINAPLAVTRSAVAYVVRLLLGRAAPLNDGLLGPVDVVVPEGSLLHPVFGEADEDCPPVAGGNVETSQRIVEALVRVFGLCAGGAGTMNNLLLGAEGFSVYETIASGAGATASSPGADAVQTHMTNTAITDAEVLEHRTPLRVRRFAIRRGSGGAGVYKGGAGAVREIESLARVSLTLLTQRRSDGAPGALGGSAGAAGAQRIVRADGSVVPLGWSAHETLEPGDRVVIETPGGGGWGAG